MESHPVREQTRPDGGVADDTPAGQVGARIRQYRKERGLTLRGLAARSGLSIGFLSQVERGISSIGLTALGSVAKALDCSVADFFDSGADSSPGSVTPLPTHFTLTRAETAATEYVSGQQTYRMLSERGPDLVLEPMLVHIAPGGRRENAYGHAGEEFAYVISGELLYEVNGVEHRLRPGDSVHLRSSVPHRIYNDTDSVTTVVSVVTPRLF
ncbi:XRE family transcriptional regulator [Micromonospora sp. DR5-3]|uniref:helix-turn-helix domain-containing protein n=1 Tax=unclassified Micromonospora TaxID=2617518 RepID=UPI0011D45AAF|nr:MULTISPECIES: XRE family transcriptional regulator [unclassified Micromonospora]MCW3815739.1 XRE family transcriptional regulator [Micromonospora sp. DR5-3]TYC14944.1 helix-turn-helix domain-containing protein [Micromonospora sp. MP36]